MSKYMTERQFKEWVDKYYQEFRAGDKFVLYVFGDEDNAANSRRGVIIINRKNGKIACSYCHPDDKWNYETGVAVAYAKYMGVEIPKVEKFYWIEELAGKEVILPNEWSDVPTTVFVTPYKKEGYVIVVNRYTGCSFRIPPNVCIPEHNIEQ